MCICLRYREPSSSSPVCLGCLHRRLLHDLKQYREVRTRQRCQRGVRSSVLRVPAFSLRNSNSAGLDKTGFGCHWQWPDRRPRLIAFERHRPCSKINGDLRRTSTRRLRTCSRSGYCLRLAHHEDGLWLSATGMRALSASGIASRDGWAKSHMSPSQPFARYDVWSLQLMLIPYHPFPSLIRD